MVRMPYRLFCSSVLSGSCLDLLRWGGENAFFGGRIDSYDSTADRYKVVYDDGDADLALEFRDYEVTQKGSKIEVVTVTATDADDTDVLPVGNVATEVPDEAADKGAFECTVGEWIWILWVVGF